MERFFFETDEALNEAAAVLRGLGARARKLLAECVATQGLTRKQVSHTTLALEGAGFIFVRDRSDVFEQRHEITPSLAGEEALQRLEGDS